MLRVLLAVTLVAEAASPRPPLYHHAATRLSMACVYAIEAYGADRDALPAIVDAAFDEVDRIDRLMSHYKVDSALSRLNRAAASGPVKVEPELFDLVAEATRYSRDSGGAFDVTVGPLMKAWGFFDGDGRVPTHGALTAALSRVGAQHVVLDPREKTIAFDRAGVEIDLGGIAKGHAVDRVVRLLKQRNVAAALISAGGSTIYGLGAPPGRGAWAVDIQDPAHARRIAMTDGVTYSHIMDPRTGKPVQGVRSVAVLAGTGTAGDALDNVFFVLGREMSREYVRRLSGVDVFFFTES
jgi:thiamine biosynthesis lipoprotein